MDLTFTVPPAYESRLYTALYKLFGDQDNEPVTPADKVAFSKNVIKNLIVNTVKRYELSVAIDTAENSITLIEVDVT